MDKTSLNYIILTLSFIFVININDAQEFSQSGINFGVKIGGARLLGEFPQNFSGIINEFDNKTSFASSLEISKYVSQRFEIGSEIKNTKLYGNTFSPAFSAEGFQAGIPSEINDPVEYINNLLGFNLFVRYFLKPADSESLFIPFVSAGVGFINYNSKFKYIDAFDGKLIFGKGINGYTKLSTPNFMVGTGFKTFLSSRFYLLTTVDFNLVDYDFLDVIHNYNEEGSRLGIIGLYTEFKIGIFCNVMNSGGSSNKHGTKKGGSFNSGYLPFAR